MPTRPPGQVVTRFAPSPTGYLHIGGARTALFNWAYARRHGGTFILRIEDTDQARSTDHATRCILEDLRWLGITWDEGPDEAASDPIHHSKGSFGPYFQSQRLDLYNQYAEQLLKQGKAYEDQGALRFRMPRKDITVHDLVLGDVTTPADKIEDLVIRKSDGFPTFHFANVIDDATMQVTHVIRAQEHLNNTHKHLALFEALGIQPPQYAHIPLIFNPDASKMSKRDKAKTARAAAKDWISKQGQGDAKAFAQAVAQTRDEMRAHQPQARELPASLIAEFLDKKNDDVDVAVTIAWHLGTKLNQPVQLPEIDVKDFRDSGYSPEVLCNYISLLGWSAGSDLEKFDNAWLSQNFSLERVGKANARFDRTKLLSFSGSRLQAMSPEQFRDKLFEYLSTVAAGAPFRTLAADPVKFTAFAEAYRPRSQTLQDPLKLGKFFTPSLVNGGVLDFDPKAVAEVLDKNNAEGRLILAKLKPELETLDDWTAQAIEAKLKTVAESLNLGLGKVAQPLRVAITGTTVSPPLGVTLFILGKQETLERLHRA